MIQTTVLAGGCFWGVEELIQKQKGVVETRVGYTGGSTQNPTYEDVRTGTTDHAESIKVTFNSEQTSYAEIFQYFFSIHDPTTLNRQGNDKGTQYRSAIFFQTDEEKQVALETIEKIKAEGFWKDPIQTQIAALDTFYDAEEYHQKYLEKNPGGYTCHFERY